MPLDPIQTSNVACKAPISLPLIQAELGSAQPQLATNFLANMQIYLIEKNSFRLRQLQQLLQKTRNLLTTT